MSTDQEATEPIDWDKFKKVLSLMSHAILVTLKGTQKVSEASYLTAIAIGGYTGLRGGEILSLKWSDIYNAKTISKQVSKSRGKKNIRSIEISNGLSNYIDATYKIVNPISLEFPILMNEKYEPISIQAFNKGLKKYLKKYGVNETVSSHTLRKTFGKRVFEKNGANDKSLLLVSQLLGHRSTEDTRRYIGITKLNMSNAYLDIE